MDKIISANGVTLRVDEAVDKKTAEELIVRIVECIDTNSDVVNLIKVDVSNVCRDVLQHRLTQLAKDLNNLNIKNYLIVPINDGCIKDIKIENIKLNDMR